MISPATRRARRIRISRLDPDVENDTFSLRDALVSDPDARVRTAALLRLNARAAQRLVPYLRDALDDRSMLVREAAFVALARAGDRAALARAARACLYDPSFRVRRMAVLFAARTCGADALEVLAVASRDPFWRVRVAARRAGAALDVAVDVRAPGARVIPAAPLADIDDPDPAVVASRLLVRGSSVDPAALVGLLGHSHRALRRIAIKEIAARGDASTLRAVTDWLVDERVPYGPLAARVTLARCGERVAPLAAEILGESRHQPPGVLCWALAATRDAPAFRDLQPCLAHEDARVRRAAALWLPEAAPDRALLFATMSALLDDVDEQTKCYAASWLASTGARDARAALQQLDPATQPTRVRAILVDLCASGGDHAALRELVGDRHGGIRAAAASALSACGALGEAERLVLERDPDPWVRQAALDSARAPLAMIDGCASVRATALDCLDEALATAWAEGALSHREPDPALRARAATLLASATSSQAIKTLLQLSRDVDLGVRSAAAEGLRARASAVRGLLEAGALEVDERIAAYTLLRLAGQALEPNETVAVALAHLALLDAVVEGRAPLVDVVRSTPPAGAVNRRPLGTTGIAVAPFGLSGAHDLGYDDFVLAQERGVNLFFWEPSHHELSRFLRARRGSSSLVVAGSYHSDGPSIERDVVRALRALRREAIDVFLAFWTRSSARVDEVSGVLRALSSRGLVRAIGVSTHDRALARLAADSGFDVVMVRHNAAHRGAESAVFPHCSAHGTGVLTFSNLCYGRMLHASPAAISAKVTAPECYRYSLSQPGVAACIAAPRRHAELVENLRVLDDPSLDAERQAELRAHGDHVYARSKSWSGENWNVWSGRSPCGRDVAAAPRAERGDVHEALLEVIGEPDSISSEL